MRDRSVLRTLSVFSGIWCGILTVGTLAVLFPQAVKILIFTCAVVVLLIITWKLAETYVND